jgi:uncharacterized protein (DUF1800 family)
MAVTTQLEAAIAAHRFGLGEADLGAVGTDPRAWLAAQIGPAEPQQGAALATGLEALHARPESMRLARKQGVTMSDPLAVERAAQRAEMHKDRKQPKSAPEEGAKRKDVESREVYHDILAADLHARLFTASQTRRPFAERLALFWANHFTVSGLAAKSRGLAGAFEREAIRPNIGGRFESLLRASTTHPAMLRYLDNQRSVGADSPAALAQSGARREQLKPKKRLGGLNENLAREVLELHTLGAASSRHPGSAAEGYTQADVTALANVLTGWASSEQMQATAPVQFDASRHQPGPKTVLGKTYPEGQRALDMVLADLARHPATATFLATKLARHFVADEPSPALIERLASAYRSSDGDLPTVYRALIDAPESWLPQQVKLKTPEEFAVSSARLLSLGGRWLQQQRDGDVSVMGQALQRAPSPAGWSDRAEDWLGPDALWKRIEWANRLVSRWGTQADARALAQASLGPWLSETTSQQIARAADGGQALALLLLSPEFQRR